MSSRLSLTIGAVAAVLFGLGAIIAPAQMLSGFGLAAPSEAVVLSRDAGATILGLGVINWLARDASGPLVRSILVGNVAVQVLEIVVNGYETATGALPAAGIAGIAIHAVLAVIFALPLVRPTRP